MKKNVLSIIPARGGSKGIIKKNLQIVGGLPLVVHSINQSLESRIVNRVVVSTDDKEIAWISKKYGAEVIERPSKFSGDKAHSDLALKHVLYVLLENKNYRPDTVVFLQPTSPIRKPEQIDQAIEKMLNENADTCFSACIEHFTGRWETDENGDTKPINYELMNRPMRQDYPEYYLENGSICVFKPEILEQTGNRFGRKIAIYPMNPIESLQIDTMEDLRLIDQLMKNKISF